MATIKLQSNSSVLQGELRLDFESSSFNDAGFTDRFARRLFFDLMFCFNKYVSVIRPVRLGAERPASDTVLDVAPAQISRDSVLINGQQVMQAWEGPLMEHMARITCRDGDVVLEIGFGLGILSRAIQAQRPKRHVIIEANRDVYSSACLWRDQSNTDVDIIHSRWEDADLGDFQADAIFFDAYPADEAEIAENIGRGRIAAEKFILEARRRCRLGGRFTFYTGCEIGVPLRVQDELLTRFGKIELEIVSGLNPPDDCNYWIASQMVVVVAQRVSRDETRGELKSQVTKLDHAPILARPSL